MLSAPLPANESQRLEALYRYNVLDTDAEIEFDELTQLAATLCHVPIALVSLVDKHRQWFKSKVGLDACETERDVAFCAHAIHQDDIFEVADASLDPRFQDNPLVTGAPNIRFYAGAPLITPEGYAIGTLCVIGYEPRALSLSQKQLLCGLAKAVVTQLELRKKNAELERLNRFRNDFIAYVSHELRTPLNAVTTFSDLLLDELKTLPVAQEATKKINHIKYSGERILSIVNSVLELTQIEAGKAKLNLTNVNTQSLLQRLEGIALALAQKAHIGLVFEVAETIPDWIQLDEDKFAQVALNIISNAVKFSLTGGQVEVSITYAKDNLLFVVRDYGVGISEDDQAKLFQKYQRIENDSNAEGTGLGLSICKGLTTLMGGDIFLNSTLGKGTLVKISIPVEPADGNTAAKVDQELEQLTLTAPCRILVVEDHAINQLVVEAVFSKMGLAIDLADSGEQCLEKVHEKHYDIVFMDIRLPGINGLETTAQLRQLFPTLPVVALTADVVTDTDTFHAVGIEHILTKPMNQNSLIRILNHYFSEQ